MPCGTGHEKKSLMKNLMKKRNGRAGEERRKAEEFEAHLLYLHFQELVLNLRRL
jgi:hypothetical protein